MRNSSVQQLQVDAFLAHILSCLGDRPDVTEVELDPQVGREGVA
jgi:hypothetical protein